MIDLYNSIFKSQFTYLLIRKVIIIIFSVSVIACSNKSKLSDSRDEQNSLSGNSESHFMIKDDAGIEIEFSSHPKKIISLAPNITETLFAIGADSMIAGVTDLCDYPPEAKQKVKTGSYISPDYEKIVSLNPDLIIMYAESTSQPIYQALKSYNLKIFISNAKNIDGVIKMIKDFGVITGKNKKADEVAESIVQKRTEYSSMNKEIPLKKALLIISVNPLMTANKNTFINEIVGLSGFDNIYRNESIDYPLLSYEDITDKNPEFIILPSDTTNEANINKYKKELGNKLYTIKAVKENKYIIADENILFRPGPRVMDGVSLLRNVAKKF